MELLGENQGRRRFGPDDIVQKEKGGLYTPRTGIRSPGPRGYVTQDGGKRDETEMKKD